METHCLAEDAVGSELVSTGAKFPGEKINRAKYREESQKWVKNTGNIVTNADSIRASSEIPRKK
jgi:hypothetical protein